MNRKINCNCYFQRRRQKLSRKKMQITVRKKKQTNPEQSISQLLSHCSGFTDCVCFWGTDLHAASCKNCTEQCSWARQRVRCKGCSFQQMLGKYPALSNHRSRGLDNTISVLTSSSTFPCTSFLKNILREEQRQLEGKLDAALQLAQLHFFHGSLSPCISLNSAKYSLLVESLKGDFKEYEGKSHATQTWVFLHSYFMNSVLGYELQK